MKKDGERDALRLIPYGLFVLTTIGEEEVNAITCNWITQASFEPLLVAVAIEKESHSHALILENGVFAINFLGKDQNPLARRMAVPHKINPHKLVGANHQSGETGAPILGAALAFLECEVIDALEIGGDHTIFIGEVVAGDVLRKEEPLTLLESGMRYK
jgi:flavin reductase (DIM6/NTAB) family NADH-FMN oxidoreductase RutF